MRIRSIAIVTFLFIASVLQAIEMTSIGEFNVSPENTPEENKVNLQKAIDWASKSGSALFVEPSEEPYPLAGGIVLRKNVSLIGVHGPTPRGTVHETKNLVNIILGQTK